MKIRTWIRNHRKDINAYVKMRCPNARVTNDKERQQWVLNDVCLYNWAQEEGCRI